MTRKKKLLIICGPTATGKTNLGIKLAKEFSAQGGSASGGNGEIISADSRQVYKEMDIGTGKELTTYKKYKVKVWGLDLVEPDYQFNVGEYQNLAGLVINDIWQRNKLPIVVGGTGFYIKSLIEPLSFIHIPPNKRLRKILGDYDIRILREKLEEIDKDRLERMNNSDRNNPRRVIRAIEIATYLRQARNYSSSLPSGRREVLKDSSRLSVSNNKNTLLVGLTASKEILFKRIQNRINKRLKQGLLKEIENLLQKGYDWNLPSMSGLGYKEFKPFFEKKASLEEVVKKWQLDEQNYLQRQITWFKKMPDVCWFDINDSHFYTRVKELLCEFLKKTS